MTRFFLAILGAALLYPALASGMSNPNAKVLIHLAPPVAKVGCTAPQASPACSGIQTAGDLLPQTYFAYVLATDAISCFGVSGLQFGVTYNNAAGAGVDVYSWTTCAQTMFAMAGWPASGTGIVVDWDPNTACQRNEPGGGGSGVTATAGYFYLAAYSADQLKIAPLPSDNRVRITDCSGTRETIIAAGSIPNPSPVGYATFSAGAVTPGYNPCGVVLRPPSCFILGLPSLTVGNTVQYFIDAVTCDGAVQWSISGNGSIQGPSYGKSVTVHADAVGSFTLMASGTDAEGLSFSCSKDVPITAPGPDCTFTGPSTIAAGASATYEALPYPGALFAWTVSGEGMITGATDLQQVTVRATSPGSFTLRLTLTFEGQPNTCNRTVIVAGSGCTICCFDDVFAESANTFYPGPDSTAAFAWSISGNGVIVGSTTRWPVVVQAGLTGGGPFTLTVQVTKNATVLLCSKVVNVLTPPPPPPGGNAQARIMLSLVPPAPLGCDRGGCCTFGRSRPCGSAVTQGGLYPTSLYYAALLVVNAETDGSPYSGISGVQCGIDYNGATGQGVDIFSWSFCGRLESPTGGWPNAGSGNRLVFVPTTGCQNIEPGGAGTGAIAQFGYFYLGSYTPDRLSITPNPSDGLAKVISCGGFETTIAGGGTPGNPSPLGYLSFSAGAVTPGYNPCNLVIPVENTTWSRIKGLFLKTEEN